MGFRDDQDATRARAEALQRELDDALRELGRLQISQLEVSSEADELRRRVAELEKTRAALPVRAPRGSAVKALVAVLVLLSVALGAIYAVQNRGKAEDAARARADAARLEQARTDAARAERERLQQEEAAARAAAAATAPTPTPAVAPEPAAPPSLTRHVELSWAAKVKRVEGGSLRRGARCTVLAGLDGDGVARLGAQVDIRCGDEPLYRWSESLGTGTQMRSCRVDETKGPGDTFLHSLVCNDLGARTGRPQLALDTEGHTATVWREGAPAFRVELTLTGDGRAPGPPLVAENESGGDSFAAVGRSARVVVVRGESPVPVGAQCRVRVEPTPGHQNCRVEVRCGDTALYGNRSSNGFNVCEHAGGTFVRVVDDRTTSEGGDPRLDLNLAARRLVIGDDAPDFEVTLTLSR